MTEPMEVSTNASGRRVANGSDRKAVRPAVESSTAHLASGSPSTRKVYAIIGPDGAGKTTIARVIAAHLEEAGARTRIAWMRSPRIVTLGVLGLLRLARLAKTVRLGDHDDVHTDLSRHPFLFHLLAWSVTFDYFLGYLGKVALPKLLLRRTVICDRFVWDAIVDLELASGFGEDLLSLPQGRILVDLGRKHRSVLVTADPDELIRRRPILSLDPRLARRLRLYQELADRFGLGTVDSAKSTEPQSVAAVLGCLGIVLRNPIAE